MKKEEPKKKKKSYYLKFAQCPCGGWKHTLHRADDGLWYYACRECGKTSIKYRAESPTDIKLGWNKYIEEITRGKK